MGLFFDRRCPYCNVVISDDAKKCHHCGEWLISEAERKNLNMAIEEDRKLKKQAENLLAFFVAIVFIILMIFVAIEGIKDTFFSKTEKDTVQENIIKQQEHTVDLDEADYNRYVRENQQQELNSKLTEQATQQKSQQPVVKQEQQAATVQTNIVVPKAKSAQAQQQNQEIDDFMN